MPSLGPVKAAQGYPNKKPYLHLACALWTPEILISDPEGMRGPKLDALRQHRVELTCAICKQAGGAVMLVSLPSASLAALHDCHSALLSVLALPYAALC